jgi:N-ethylmaleimide reductase
MKVTTPEQIAGWRQVTDAVHSKGGKIFVQLWHVGRVSHVSVQPGGAAPVAPSAIRAQAKTFVNNAFVDVSEPRALALEEIPDIVESFRQAAANAIAAGFDGVEVHGANGYLLDQFLRETANVRTDAYGGSVENRARPLIEVTAAVAREIGAGRTGMRISPVSPASGIMPFAERPPGSVTPITCVEAARSTPTGSGFRPRMTASGLASAGHLDLTSGLHLQQRQLSDAGPGRLTTVLRGRDSRWS